MNKKKTINRAKLVSLVLAINVFLTACGMSNENNKKPVSNPVSYSVNSESEKVLTLSSNNIENVNVLEELTNEEKELLDNNFIVSNETIMDFDEMITNYNVDYPYEELYANENINNFDYTPTINNNIIVNNNIDFNKLYNKVLENNKMYMNEYSVNNFKGTTDEFVKSVCVELTDQVNYYLNNYNCDVDSLEEKLSELKIFSFEGSAYGYFDSERDLFAINKVTGTKEVINHEIVHLTQASSIKENKNNNYNYRNGFCYEVSDSNINPYNWVWLVESSAESLSMKYNNSDNPNVYEEDVRMLNTMKLITFNNNYNLETSLFTKDINKLYEYFNATSDIEKENVRKMMYGITVVNNNTPGKEGNTFYNCLRSNYNSNENLETEFKNKIALSESLIFYKSLSRKIVNNEINLKDVYSTISTFEMELSRQTWYKTKFNEFEDFIKNYNDIQNEFFGILSINLNISIDELKDLYFKYNNSYKKNIINHDIKWLKNDENELLNRIDESIYENRRDAISLVYNNNFNNELSR